MRHLLSQLVCRLFSMPYQLSRVGKENRSDRETNRVDSLLDGSWWEGFVGHQWRGWCESPAFLWYSLCGWLAWGALFGMRRRHQQFSVCRLPECGKHKTSRYRIRRDLVGFVNRNWTATGFLLQIKPWLCRVDTNERVEKAISWYAAWLYNIQITK